MRVLHILHQYLPDHVGGVELYTHSLARAQQDAGYDVILFCRASGVGQSLDRATCEGVPIYRAISGPLSPARRFRSTLGDRFLANCLSHVLRETQPEVIHIQHLMGLPVNVFRAHRLAAPLIVTLHDYWWVCANAQLITDYGSALCEGPWLWLNCARCGLARGGARRGWPLLPFVACVFAWRSRLLKHFRPLVAAWIAPTAFVRDWHVSHGFPADRMHVIGHGVQPPPTDLARPAGREGDGRPPRLAYVGGLAWQKGVHVLIDAFNALPGSWQLAISGDETAFPSYCADLHRRATHPGIRFTGRLDRTQVWQTLAAADALVVPSLWFETASLVTQEAFASGTPVIASDLGALSERVHNGVDGLLFSPGDVVELRKTLQRLADEPDLLPRLRRGIRQPIYMADHMKRLEHLYRETTQAGRR